MFDNADLFGPETDDVEQNFFDSGQFNDTVQVFYFKESVLIKNLIPRIIDKNQ